MTVAYLSFIFRALAYMCLRPNESVSIAIALALQILNGTVILTDDILGLILIQSIHQVFLML